MQRREDAMIDSLSLESQATTARITDWTSRLRGAVNRTCCVLMGGHWRVLHVSRNHMALRCVGCGDTTTGWQVGRPARREREHGVAAARRHAA
jgi:hypothetical protein